ncbi:MAG: hypothetical protein A2583_13910 [Bdellovibrionales bacterium RIFOXYD1_FULL_53_11]|nr:MAG: hypothetical protein A2583_13910 [Bdellovibrionales bacterium RIFOXYD1_FULL_53_11]
MPNDSDAWRRFRQREDKREEEGGLAKPGKPGASRSPMEGLPKDDTARFQQLLDQADPMIEQVGNLYAQFFSGAEKRAPIEKRAQLDHIMDVLFNMPKATPAQKFRYGSLQNRYIVNRDKWDKTLKALEDGKRKRTTVKH